MTSSDISAIIFDSYKLNLARVCVSYMQKASTIPSGQFLLTCILISQGGYVTSFWNVCNHQGRSWDQVSRGGDRDHSLRPEGGLIHSDSWWGHQKHTHWSRSLVLKGRHPSLQLSWDQELAGLRMRSGLLVNFWGAGEHTIGKWRHTGGNFLFEIVWFTSVWLFRLLVRWVGVSSTWLMPEDPRTLHRRLIGLLVFNVFIFDCPGSHVALRGLPQLNGAITSLRSAGFLSRWRLLLQAEGAQASAAAAAGAPWPALEPQEHSSFQALAQDPGLEPMTPTLAGRLPITTLPGSPQVSLFTLRFLGVVTHRHPTNPS